MLARRLGVNRAEQSLVGEGGNKVEGAAAVNEDVELLARRGKKEPSEEIKGRGKHRRSAAVHSTQHIIGSSPLRMNGLWRTRGLRLSCFRLRLSATRHARANRHESSHPPNRTTRPRDSVQQRQAKEDRHTRVVAEPKRAVRMVVFLALVQ